MNWDTIRNKCESTPFQCVDLGDKGRYELYWSSRAGTYGHQVYAVIVHEDYGKDTMFYKTNGCGYCKESEATHHAMLELGYKPKGMQLGSCGVSYEFRKGGNYYKVPNSKLTKIK